MAVRNTRAGLVYGLAFSLTISMCFSVINEAESKTVRAGATYSRQLVLADKNLQTGQYTLAEQLYQNLLKQNPANDKVRSALAVAQAELFKLDAAQKNAEMVLKKNPKHAMAHMALGVVFRNRTASLDMEYRSRREEYLHLSASELERALRLSSNSPEIHNQLGLTYRFQGLYDKAQQQFEQALNLDSGYSEALLNKGVIRLVKHDVTGAKTLFQQALKLNSKNYMAHCRLGEALLQDGNSHGAIQSLNTALSLNPGNAVVLSKLAQAYDIQGNHSAAVAYYHKAIQSNPNYFSAYTELAALLDSRGDGELAMAELRSALNVNPHFSAAKNQIGRLALTVDKPEQALAYYKSALQDNPQDPEALQGLSQSLSSLAQNAANTGQVLGDNGELLEAEKAIETALTHAPDDLRLHLAHMKISQLAGKPPASRAELETLLSTPATSKVQQVMHGEALLALDRYQEADQVFNELLQKTARQPDELLLLADTLKINGDLQRARQAYQMALLAEPGNLKAERGLQRIAQAEANAKKTLRLADALNNWRQKKSAVDYYEEALAQNPRQPEARLALAKLYEKFAQPQRAADSYRAYLGLMPNLPKKQRQRLEQKIAKLHVEAQKESSSQASAP